MIGVEWNLQIENPSFVSDKSHDIVFFCEVIEHLCRFPVEVLTDIKRIIKPGGYLLVTTVNFLRLSNRWRTLTGHSPLIDPFKRSPDGRYHIREFTFSEMTEYIQAAGFEVLEAPPFLGVSIKGRLGDGFFDSLSNLCHLCEITWPLLLDTHPWLNPNAGLVVPSACFD